MAHMLRRRFSALFVAGLVVLLSYSVLEASPTSAAPVSTANVHVDCTLYVYPPSHAFGFGYWRPKTTPHGWSTTDWLDYCSGRFKPQKKTPNRPQGSWGVTISLRQGCTYTADESWLSDSYGWKMARIHVSPYWR